MLQFTRVEEMLTEIGTLEEYLLSFNLMEIKFEENMRLEMIDSRLRIRNQADKLLIYLH